jgi:hypothetical protein
LGATLFRPLFTERANARQLHDGDRVELGYKRAQNYKHQIAGLRILFGRQHLQDMTVQ